MDKIQLNKDNLESLKKILQENEVFIEGKILNFIDTTDPEIEKYVEHCKITHKEKVKRRLELAQELQSERKKAIKALEKLQKSNEQIQAYSEQLDKARQEAEEAKDEALTDLQIMTKKQQIETFDKVVRFMIYSIVGGMILLNILFGITLYKGLDNQILMTTWASTMTMVFTNAFSIIATIMGVKKIIQENGTTYESYNNNNRSVGSNYNQNNFRNDNDCIDHNKPYEFRPSDNNEMENEYNYLNKD